MVCATPDDPDRIVDNKRVAAESRWKMTWLVIARRFAANEVFFAFPLTSFGDRLRRGRLTLAHMRL